MPTATAHNRPLKLLLDTLAICSLVGCAGILMFGRWRQKSGESTPKRALWKHFDDTHHWDPAAEEWVRNDG
jgi:hypothetical protein